MSLSSISVVLNALTINLIKLNKTNDDYGCEINLNNLNNQETMEDTNVKTITLKVDGMMCQRCVKHVENACLKVDGVLSAIANLESNTVTITYENDNALQEAMVNICAEDYQIIE